MKKLIVIWRTYEKCERCWTISTSIEKHHIVNRCEARHHVNIGHPRNIIKVCQECHIWFHKCKWNREKYIKERNLEELFTDLSLFTKK